MKQLNLYYLGGGGGGSVPDGKTVTPINDAVIWQQCAGISNPTYTSIGEILADSGMLQTLMASDNAVDYLVRSKAFMATRSLVPVMTSDNTPSGVAFASGEAAGYGAYRVFDGDNSKEWACYDGAGAQYATNQWVGYDFETPTIVNKIFILPGNAGDTSSSGCRVKNYRIEASNDKVSWDILTSQTYTASNSAGETVVFTNNTAYRYYRCYVVDNITTQFVIVIKTLTFYSPVGICDTADAMTAIGQNNYAANTLLADATWRTAICGSTYKNSVINAQISEMTSNNTPVGECSGTSITTDFDYWKAFNTSEIKGWMPGGSDYYNVAKVFYHFPNAVIPCIADLLWLRPASSTTTIKVIGSNDGLVWTDLTSNITLTNNVAQNGVSLTSGNKYEYVGLVIVSNSVSVSAGEGYKLQIYGRKDV